MMVRRAQREDLPRIVEIERLCFPEEAAFPPKMFSYLLTYAEALVAYNGQVEGFVVGYTSGKMGLIYTLDVHPDYRRRGVGGVLMKSMEEALASKGARILRLEAAVENPAALALYLKAGFRKGSPIKDYYGLGKDAWRMIKERS